MRFERGVVNTKSCLHAAPRKSSQAAIARATSSAKGSILHLPPLPLTTTRPPVRSPCPNGDLRFTNNGSDILGICHVDTVPHKPRYKESHGKAYSTALDDRLGVYILTKALPERGIVLDFLLTDNEESGASTARYFDAPKVYNWCVEFDRAGSDVVLYQYDDGQLDDAFAEVGLEVGFGSYSDICDLPDAGHTCCLQVWAVAAHRPSSRTTGRSRPLLRGQQAGVGTCRQQGRMLLLEDPGP
jgi:hypothetical protein